ncbi:glutathione S-transferase family protein [Polaromonas sp.]|uniref:glutathione S-transferase family protein n=1 Tax=Polaromonas sp. TaxID=1869339 RepID=UPI003FA7596A
MVADVVADVYGTHQPIASGLYYEEQKKEAKRRAEDFRKARLPEFLAWFEAVLALDKASASASACAARLTEV